MRTSPLLFWSRHLLLGGLLLLIVHLMAAPERARRALEAQPGFPARLSVLVPQGAPLPVARTPEARAAREALAGLDARGRLGFWTAAQVLAGQQPTLHVSRTLMSWGVVQVTSGAVRSGTTLALDGGPYVPGQVLAGGQVVQGTVSLSWLPVTLSDASVVHVTTFRNVQPQDLPTLLIPTDDDVTLWAARASQAFGLEYTAQPLSAYLGRATRYVDDARLRLQRLTVTWLTLLLLGGLMVQLSGGWFAQRERLRVERMLGRSEGAFMARWLRLSLQSWGWGVLGAGVVTAALVAAHRLPLRGRDALLVWGVISGAALLGSVLLGLGARRVPLGRTRLRGGVGQVLPALLTGALVLGVPLLGTQALRLWLEQQAVVRQIGEHTLVAVTLPNATVVPTPARCPAGVPCLPVGWSDLYLWPPSFTGAEEPEFMGVGQFRPQDAKALGLKIVQGRLPEPGRREVLVSRRTLERLTARRAGVGVGSALDAGFRVVGVVDLPANAGVTLFGNYRFYDMAVFVPSDAAGLGTLNGGQSVFLSPLGGSALVMPRLSAEQAGLVAAGRRTMTDLEVYRPAGYAAQVAAGTRASVTWLLGLLLVGGVLAGFSYHAALHLILAQRAEEIAVWRLLGLTASGVLRRLSAGLLRVLLVAGGTGLGAALLLERRQLTLSGTLGLVTLLALLGVWTALMLGLRRRMAREPLERLYREGT